ncbi:hypothetical protein WA158_005723 [Blastocystis sp. Blastoise]
MNNKDTKDLLYALYCERSNSVKDSENEKDTNPDSNQTETFSIPCGLTDSFQTGYVYKESELKDENAGLLKFSSQDKIRDYQDQDSDHHYKSRSENEQLNMILNIKELASDDLRKPYPFSVAKTNSINEQQFDSDSYDNELINEVRECLEYIVDIVVKMNQLSSEIELKEKNDTPPKDDKHGSNTKS